MNNPPLPIGSEVRVGLRKAKISMVGLTLGERYYWLTFNDGSIGMFPAFCLEKSETESTGAK
jgi:hypothetical protein